MEKIFIQPLFYIYLVYSISFLIMSYAATERITKGTNIALISSFYLLAFFGLVHGITEMTDWFRFIAKFLNQPDMAFFTYLSQISMILSFVLLLQFAVNLLSYKSAKKNIIRSLPLIFLALFIIFSFLTGITDDIPRMGLIGRHTFGFAGSLLSAFALLRLAGAMKAVENRKLNRWLTVVAAGFALYAVFGGLTVEPIAGFPIQLFRAACALIIAIATFSALEVFVVE